MSTDLMLWIVRAIIIAVGIIIAIMVGKRKKTYYFGLIALGITLAILGAILLILSSITDLSLFYGSYLTAVGVVALIVVLVIRNKKKNRSSNVTT